jgi:glycosyltransferase involved in cell wall biosynthesis
MTPPLVSCIVPVHNGARHLAEALDSILAQEHRPLEVVVVDDGSTDASAALASAYGEPVRVVRNDAPLGPPAARTAGMGVARGELVAFLDADDMWHPAKLARQLPHLAGPPELDASFSEMENFWEPGLEEEEARWRAAGRTRSAYHFGTLVARRGLFDRVPIPAARRHTDIQQWVVAVREIGARLAVLPELLAYRRRHSGNITRTDDIEAVHEEYLDLVKSVLDRRRARTGG